MDVQDYYSPISSKFIVNKGYFFTVGFEKYEKKVFNMEVRDSDVWVISFPKSGTTWTQEMVWMIMNDMNFEKGQQETLNARSPYLESSACYDFEVIKSDNLETYNNLPLWKTDSITYIENKMKAEPCVVIKTHLPFQLLPKQIQEGTTKAKIIYVARNPKDVCISSFYHFQKYAGFSGSFEQFFEWFLEGKVAYAPYWSHVQPYYERRDTDLLLITYEDMKKDLQSIIRKVAEYLGKSLNDKQVAELADHLSFEKMKVNESVNKKSTSAWLKDYQFSNTEHIRSGKVGSYKEIMSPEMITRFDKWMNENIERTGVHFEYNN